VAGGLAYVFYVRPQQERAEEQRLARDLARQWAADRGLQEVDRAAPRPDPQDTGLVKGKAGKSP
jgi:hypothetical protein